MLLGVVEARHTHIRRERLLCVIALVVLIGIYLTAVIEVAMVGFRVGGRQRAVLAGFLSDEVEDV